MSKIRVFFFSFCVILVAVVCEVQSSKPVEKSAFAEEGRREFDEFLKDGDLDDFGWFRDFKDKVLFSTEVGKISVGVYGVDILKILFLSFYIVLDKVFFDRFKSYYLQNVLSDLKEKQRLLVALYDEVYSQCRVEGLKKSEIKGYFLNSCCSILNVDKSLDYKLFSYMFLDLFSKEVTKFFESQVFTCNPMGFFRIIKTNIKTRDQKVDDKNMYDFSLYSIVEPFLVESIFGMLFFVEEEVPVLRSFLLRLVGWDSQIFESYSFNLSRRILISSIFLKRLNLWYQNLFRNYINQNIETLLRILSEIKREMRSCDRDVNESLENFIRDGYGCSFKKWFDYKNHCYGGIGFLFEIIFLILIICKGGILLRKEAIGYF